MGPIAHTKGWSESRIWDPSYSGGAQVVFARSRLFSSAGAFFSISPEILKPIRRERRVANRRSNRPVAKIVLDRSSVPPIVGQLVAARVAQHMAADLEREARRLASARNHALVTCHAQGRQALGGEHVKPRLPLPLQAAQGAEFAPTNRVDTRAPALGAAHMQLAGAEIDIVPAQGDKLASAQPVAVGEQDRGGVPMTPTVAIGGVHELLDLPLGQILAGTA